MVWTMETYASIHVRIQAAATGSHWVAAPKQRTVLSRPALHEPIRPCLTCARHRPVAVLLGDSVGLCEACARLYGM